MAFFRKLDKKPLVKIRDSIAMKLLTIVFSIYFVVTLSVTAVHMVAEYFQAKNKILKELEVYKNTFHDGLSKAIWNLDNEQISALLTGIALNPIVIGVKIVGVDNEIVDAVGTYVNQKNEIVENMSTMDTFSTNILFFDDLFSYKFPIVYSDFQGQQDQVGKLVVYSNTGVIFDSVKLGFIFIIVNSIIKTLALWFIFLYVSQFILSRPLSVLNDATHLLDMDNLENNKIDIQSNDRNELTLIGDAFNKMTDKLALSKYRLTSYQKIYGILSSNSFKNAVKILFREICINTVVDNGVLYTKGKTTFQAIKYFNPDIEFFAPDLLEDEIEGIFNADAPVFINSIKQEDPVLKFLPKSLSEILMGCHLLFIKLRTIEPTFIVLYRDRGSSPFDIADKDYINGMINEIFNSQKNIKVLQDKSKIEGEMATASLVQQSFIPEKAPSVPGFEIAHLFNPAKSVSGDYFDFLPMGESSIGMVIADVSGKGVPAAMYANMARILLRDKAIRFSEPGKLLCELNKSLKNEFQSNRFLTMSYMSLDYKSSVIRYVNAGHEPTLLLRKNSDKIEFLKPSGYPFSALHADIFDLRLKEESCQLNEGDLVFCYTDGLTDIINYRDEMYGEERLYNLVKKYRDYPVKKIIEKVNQTLLAYQGENEQMDDMTVIALKKQ